MIDVVAVGEEDVAGFWGEIEDFDAAAEFPGGETGGVGEAGRTFEGEEVLGVGTALDGCEEDGVPEGEIA